MDVVYEGGLIVGLVVLDQESVALSGGGRDGHVIVEGVGAVNLGLAVTQQVQIGSRQQKDRLAHLMSSRQVGCQFI